MLVRRLSGVAVVAAVVLSAIGLTVGGAVLARPSYQDRVAVDPLPRAANPPLTRRPTPLVAGSARKRTLALAERASGRPATSTPCSIPAGACVDLSARRSWLLDGGRVVYGPVPITSGRSGYATPTGLFQVLYKDFDHHSREFGNAPMPYSVFFSGLGIAFHAGSLSQQSHGCIHLSRVAAAKYFHTLEVGQPVQVVASRRAS